MSTVQVETTVPASAQQVWEIITDITLAARWMPDIKERQLLSSPPIGAGSRWQDRGVARGKPFSMTCEVITWEPPHRLAYQHAGARQAGVQWVESITLVEQGDATLVQVRLDYSLARGALGQVYDRLFFRRDIRQTLENRLTGLRDYIERQEEGPGP